MSGYLYRCASQKIIYKLIQKANSTGLNKEELSRYIATMLEVAAVVERKIEFANEYYQRARTPAKTFGIDSRSLQHLYVIDFVFTHDVYLGEGVPPRHCYTNGEMANLIFDWFGAF